MNLHANAQEQVMQIEKYFSSTPVPIRFRVIANIMILETNDILLTHHYAQLISNAGWACIVVLNSFCPKAILQVYLHRA